MKIKVIEENKKLTNNWENTAIIISQEQLGSVVNEQTENEINRALKYITENKLETCGDNYLATFKFEFKTDDGKTVSETVGLYTNFETFSIYIAINKLVLAEKLKQLVNTKSTPSSLFMSIIGSLTESDYLTLEKIENELTTLQDKIANEKDLEHINKKINAYRKELVSYKQRYDQLLNMVEFFEMHVSTIDSEEEKAKFKVLDRRIPKLRNEVLYLRDLLSQLKDSCQSQFDMRQNHLMKIFTIITAIFMPLQLIAGWYGMNLAMPEFGWKYTYPVVGGLSVLIVVGLLVFFSKKKWFK